MSQRRPTRRERARAEDQAREKRRRLLILGLAGVAALAAAGLAYQILRPGSQAEPVREGSPGAPLDTDGKAWGARDAPVLIEEFSDFQ